MLEPSRPISPPSTRAIGVGGAVDWLYGGTQVEGGYRLTDTLWVRGRLDRGPRSRKWNRDSAHCCVGDTLDGNGIKFRQEPLQQIGRDRRTQEHIDRRTRAHMRVSAQLLPSRGVLAAVTPDHRDRAPALTGLGAALHRPGSAAAAIVCHAQGQGMRARIIVLTPLATGDEGDMVTQQTATIYITNRTDGDAWILLYHTNSSHGTQRESWNAGPGQTVGPMTVYFETGVGTRGILDYWSVMLNVSGGSTPGQYITSGTASDPYWRECRLQHGDAGKTITLAVDTTTFEVPLDSGGCTGGMTKLAPYSPITNVFVVMLENQSFDRMFAMSGIPGIIAATTRDSNSHDGTAYHVQNGAPVVMPTDPGHEFLDVVEQLGGEGAEYPPGGLYPAINNSGFAANYATSITEGSAPPRTDIGDVMACFGTQSQLPVFYQLATQFALCDQWFSSLPGPTWPNRYFVHGASSSGLDHSPSLVQMGKWEIDGFPFSRGSIFQALGNASIPYRLYSDFNPSPGSLYGLSLFSDDPQDGSLAGAIPQASSLQGVSLMDFHSLSYFASDLQRPYPYTYTFIEPHYGDIVRGSYAGGSSQHPVDDMAGGQNLVQAVYEAIRNSPYWNRSLLIITFDEHGGFYDSVAPGAATAPGDHPHDGFNEYGFTFEQYGVRVPAIVVSPLIAAGTVDHTTYDHASVLATLERLFGLKALTQRDAAASDVTHLFTHTAPRGDCPAKLNRPAPLLEAARRPLPTEELAQIDQQPLPESGDVRGVLSILLKTEIELSSRSPAAIAGLIAKVKGIKTCGEARAYIASVMDKVRAARAAGVRRH